MKKINISKVVRKIDKAAMHPESTGRDKLIYSAIKEIINNNIVEQEEDKKIEKIDLGSSNLIQTAAYSTKINEIIDKINE